MELLTIISVNSSMVSRTYSSFSRWENNGWICALVPRMRTLNGDPRGQESQPLPGSLNTIREEKRENTVFIHFPSLSSETGICQLGVVDPLWIVAEFPSWEDYNKQTNLITEIISSTMQRLI